MIALEKLENDRKTVIHNFVQNFILVHRLPVIETSDPITYKNAAKVECIFQFLQGWDGPKALMPFEFYFKEGQVELDFVLFNDHKIFNQEKYV